MLFQLYYQSICYNLNIDKFSSIILTEVSNFCVALDPHVKQKATCVDTVEGVCNGFLPYTRFLGFLEFSGYHQWQQESQ